jgi:hypothetical protein
VCEYVSVGIGLKLAFLTVLRLFLSFIFAYLLFTFTHLLLIFCLSSNCHRDSNYRRSTTPVDTNSLSALCGVLDGGATRVSEASVQRWDSDALIASFGKQQQATFAG